VKNWIGRLLGGNGKETAAAAGTDEAAEVQTDNMTAEVDAAFYRWLVRSSGTNASPEVEQQILDAVRALVDDPEKASVLVPRVPELITQLLGALSDEDRAIGSSAIMAVRQTGGAVGAAISGVAANLVGFSDGLSDASARGAAFWVFAAVVPLALVGTWATFRMTGSARAAIT